MKGHADVENDDEDDNDVEHIVKPLGDSFHLSLPYELETLLPQPAVGLQLLSPPKESS